jgi:ubiquinone/menaquinone biosynthesis C-methylase UbiE
MTLDFSFDRVAHAYRQQRAHPPAVSHTIGRAIASIIGTNARALELGVGTGRIAWPVVDAGCHVVGIDISLPMLRELVHAPQEAHPARLRVLQADMHALPFATDTFDAVFAVHVLHLARDWRSVLTETARVLRPGGAFIRGRDWTDPHSVVGQVRQELRRQVIQRMPDSVPPAAGAEMEQTLVALGASQPEAAHEISVAEWTSQISPAEVIAAMAARDDAESWVLPDHLLEPIIAHLQAWAITTWPDPAAKQTVTQRFVLQLTRGNWGGP